MLNSFAAQESVSLPQPSPEFAQYLQPYQVAIAFQDQAEILRRSGGDRLVRFRLHLPPLAFFQMQIFALVDLDVWSTGDRYLYLESQAATVQVKLLGMEIQPGEFSLKLRGKIYQEAERLIGEASLNITVEVPPPISLLPSDLRQQGGDRLLAEVLSDLKLKLLQQLIKNYANWLLET
ncbi:MAG: DUF1997 domain-containing protein [Pseudanabaenaceae cyanobacterium bins.68]|nr:DUF1997 domain-containing protein [Pseudanabaenaceae cyanobacterium bins.68]